MSKPESYASVWDAIADTPDAWNDAAGHKTKRQGTAA